MHRHKPSLILNMDQYRIQDRILGGPVAWFALPVVTSIHRVHPLFIHSFSPQLKKPCSKYQPWQFSFIILTKDYIFCSLSDIRQPRQTCTLLLNIATGLTNLFLHAQLFMDCIKYAWDFARAAHVSFWVSLGGTCLLLECPSGLNFPDHMCTGTHTYTVEFRTLCNVAF